MNEHYSGHDPETGCGLVLVGVGFVTLVGIAMLIIYVIDVLT